MASTDQRPPPKDLAHHLSRSTAARAPSAVKSFYKYMQRNLDSVAGGFPSNHYFPFDTLEAKVARSDRWKPTPNRPVDPPSDPAAIQSQLSDLSVSKSLPHDAITVPHTSAETEPNRRIDLDTALQYGLANGYTPLYNFLRNFTREHMHPNVPYRGGPEIILTEGNQNGLMKVLLALSNEWSELKDWRRDREGILVEAYSFMGAIGAMTPRGLNVTPVAIDEEGMLIDGPGGLRDVLENWDFSQGKRPHLLYTITMGQNPTSGVLSVHRRREILALANRFDIIIIEDDPYWYLQFPTATAHNTTTTAEPGNVSFNPHVPMFANGEPRPEVSLLADGSTTPWKTSGFDFLDSLVPSYLNFDTEGRVIRLDTFSKTVAPGCRLGWITAQPALIERIQRITETCEGHPSGFVQSLIATLLLGGPKAQGNPATSGWQAEGWVRWLAGLRGNYERRMNQMCRTLDEGRHLVQSGDHIDDAASDSWAVVEKTPLLSFDRPYGGMFLWLTVHFESHPLWSEYQDPLSTTTISFASAHTTPPRVPNHPVGPTRLAHALWLYWLQPHTRVLVTPGQIFSPTPTIAAADGWRHFRLCFAALDEDILNSACERLVKGTQAFWRITDSEEIEQLIRKEDEEALSMGGGESGHDEGLVRMTGHC